MWTSNFCASLTKLNHLCPEMQAMANLAILTKSCHSHDGGEFGKISPNSQINANRLNTWKPAMLVDLMILAKCDKFGKILSKCQMHAKGTNKVANLTNTVNLANMANMTIFRQRPQFR